MGTKVTFTGGEIEPDAWARVDMEQFRGSFALGLNALPVLTGPLAKRPGFYYNGLLKSQSSASLLVEYVRSRYDVNVVEISDGTTRIWKPDRSQVTVSGSPYEVPSTPFVAADLPYLRWALLGNVLVFFRRDGQRPYRLQKVADNNWNWASYDFADGPWQAENLDATKTLACDKSQAGTNGTLTATGFSPFDPGMVGTIIRLRSCRGLPGIKSWYSGYQPKGHEIINSNGRVYFCSDVTTQVTGNTPPDHDIGRKSDGIVDWTYIHDGEGVVQITAYISPTQVSVGILRNLPSLGVLSTGLTPSVYQFDSTVNYALPATFAWAFSSYSDYYGWPTAWPCLKGERLIVGGGKLAPDKYDASQVAGYYASKASFSPGLGTGLVLEDDAIQGYCGDESFQVQAFVSTSMLIALTHGGEAAIVGSTTESPITPQTATPKTLSYYGSDDPRPAKIGNLVVHVVRGAQALRGFNVSPYNFPGTEEILTDLVDHINGLNFRSVRYLGAPSYALWCRMGDNSLATMIYRPQQALKAWCRQALGGGFVAESICVVPDSNGNDTLWVAAMRTKGGSPQRVMMTLASRRDPVRLDMAGRYSGAPITGLTGLSHLEGEDIRIMLGDGSGAYTEVTETVTSGAVNFPANESATEVVWGLAYRFRYESLPLNTPDKAGQYLRPKGVDLVINGVRATIGWIGGSRLDVQDDIGASDVVGRLPTRQIFQGNFEADSDYDPRIFVEDISGYDLKLISMNVNV